MSDSREIEIRAKSSAIDNAQHVIDSLMQLSLALYDKSRKLSDLDDEALLDLQSDFDKVVKKFGIKSKTNINFDADSISEDKLSLSSKILRELAEELAEVSSSYIQDGAHGKHNSNHVEALATKFSHLSEVSATLGKEIPQKVELNNWINTIIGYHEGKSDVWDTQSAIPVSYRARVQDAINNIKELRQEFSQEKLAKIGSLLDIDVPNNVVVNEAKLEQIKAIIRQVVMDEKLTYLTNGNSINSAFDKLQNKFQEILSVVDSKVVDIAAHHQVAETQAPAPATKIVVATEDDYSHEAGVVGDPEDRGFMQGHKVSSRS